MLIVTNIYNSGQTPIRTAVTATEGKSESKGSLDENGEPRFLENVQMFLKRAGSRTDIPKDIYNYIESC